MFIWSCAVLSCLFFALTGSLLKQPLLAENLSLQNCAQYFPLFSLYSLFADFSLFAVSLLFTLFLA